MINIIWIIIGFIIWYLWGSFAQLDLLWFNQIETYHRAMSLVALMFLQIFIAQFIIINN